MKKFHITLAILFFVPLLVLGVMSITDLDETVSLSEKRILSSMPLFSIQNWFNSEFMNKFEEYYTDTFPFREGLINYNHALNWFYHFTPIENESIAIIPFDENLMLEGAENIESINPQGSRKEETVIDEKPVSAPELEYPELGDEVKTDSDILIIGSMAMSVVEQDNAAINRYAENLSNAAGMIDNVNFYCVIVPTSCEFYSPEFYRTDIRNQKNMIDICYSLMEGVGAADPYEYLYMHADEYIYFRTDHHWTALGAYYGYLAFCESAGLTAVQLDQYKTGNYEGFVGTYYVYTRAYTQSRNLLENPDTVHYYMPVVEVDAYRYTSTDMSDGRNLKLVNDELPESNNNKYLCFIGGDFPIIRADTSVDNGRSCVIIKDSFGNVFSPYLASHYETLYIVDPRFFNCEEYPAVFKLEDFCIKNNIDDVILVNNTANINSYGYIKMLNSMFK
jgi:hypothetical protein